MAARVKNKEKRAETYRYNMIKKHGSEEAYKEYMREIASRGGRKKKASDNGFAKSTEWAREAAARSHESRRRKKGNGEEVSAR